MALARVAGGRLILVRKRNVEWVVSSRGGFAAIEGRLEEFGAFSSHVRADHDRRVSPAAVLPVRLG